MEMQLVVSSTIEEIGYEEHSETLVVRFKTSSYQYNGVPAHIYTGLMESPSKGQFHAVYIKNQYPYEKIG